MICNFHTCSVCQCEEKEIPLPWKQDSEYDTIDKKIDETFYRWVEKFNTSSPNWIIESEIDSNNGVYVNLENNPEAFTGYQGQHIWNAIYQENCFSSMLNQLCHEEKVFYKIISGLHSNINIHLSKNYLDMENNSTSTNITMLYDRVTKHPDRINNLFFLYSLLMKAFDNAKDQILNHNFYTGNEEEDIMTKTLLEEIFNSTKELKDHYGDCLIRNTFNDGRYESIESFFRFDDKKLDELKLRFKNVTQIIDCVSCQKCKLHGKLQVYGLATMFKVLFGKNGDDLPSIASNWNLKRNEIISFVNLVGKVSRSVHYLFEINKSNVDKNYLWEVLCFSLTVFISSFMTIMICYWNYYFIKNRHKLEKNKRGRNRIEVNSVSHARNLLTNPDLMETEVYQYLNKVKASEDYVISKKNN